MMRIILSSILVIALAVGCNQKKYTSVSVTEFSNLIEEDKVQLLDVRTMEEFEEGHIPNANFLDLKDSLFTDKAYTMLSKEKPVGVYCRSGRRSKEASKKLVQMGYDVIELDSGFTKWSKDNFPVQ